MSRVFWQLFAFAFSAVVGGCVWLVAHMLDTDPWTAVGAGALAFLGLETCMSRFLARHTAPDDPEEQEPYTDADKKILNEEYVPRVLRRPLAESLTPDDEDTAVFDGQIFNLRRPKAGPRAAVDDATQVMNADRVYRYQGRRRAGVR